MEIAMSLISVNLRSANQGLFAMKISTFMERISLPQRPIFGTFGKVGLFGSKHNEPLQLGASRLELPSYRFPSLKTMGMKENNGNSPSSGSDDQSSPENQSSSEKTHSDNARTHHMIQDARTYRANLVAWERSELLGTGSPDQYAVPSVLCNLLGPKWAHPISMLEAGCILVATEKLDGVSTFERSVILILGTGNRDTRDGPFGVLINRPCLKKIKDTKLSAPDLATHFADCYLNFGGPLDGSMMLLRASNQKPPPSFQQVTTGLYFGGRNSLRQAANLLRKGILNPQDFSFFVGYAGWQLNQLREEIESGYWYIAACSINLIIGASPDSSSTLWEEVLQLMGGHYSELSRKPKPDSS